MRRKVRVAAALECADPVLVMRKAFWNMGTC